MNRSFSSNLRGKVRNFNLPTNRPLVPLYEAIVNSINAIDERAQKQSSFPGKIEIEVIRERSLFPKSDDNSVLGFTVRDNGIGFTEENMSSFMVADSDYKIEIGGKGVGRFSWLKAFSTVQVSSIFSEGDLFLKREFEFSLSNNEIEDIVQDVSSGSDYQTVVTLSNYHEDYKKAVPKQLTTIATRIIQHCLVYFLHQSCPEILIYDSDNRISLNQFFADHFSTDENKSSFEVGGERFCLLNVKINERSFSHKNRLYFCANERLVDSKNLEKYIVNLDSGLYDQEEFWYLGVLTSDYLDRNVDMNRLSFSIPQESNTQFADGVPSIESIIVAAAHEVEDYLGDYLRKVEEQKQKRVKDFTTRIAPQYRHLELYVPEQIAALRPGLTDEELDDALHSIKRSFENQTKSECNRLLEKLKQGIITSEEYQQKFKEQIGKVSDVNRATLAEYIVHRKIILKLFEQGLEIKDDGKFNLEQYMHQLIYPMRTTSDELPYENHNLWLIDERLSFCQFISSDKPFDNSPQEDRTDLLMLDQPTVVAESKNTGLAFDSIAIIELKRPMRDNYNMSDNPIVQLLDYAQKIRDGKAKDSKHRIIRVTPNTMFYLYALCDITPSLERVLDNMSYTRTADNLGAYSYNSQYHAYIEVLSYDKVRNDSEKRNRVLFEKLGI